MPLGFDGDKHHKHFGVRQTNRTKKKKSRRLIDPEDIPVSFSFVTESIIHDIHIFALSFGTADPWHIILIIVDQSVLSLLH